MVDQVLSDLPKRSLGSYIRTRLPYLGDIGWHALFNGFYLDDTLKIEPLTYVVIITSISWC